MCHMPLHDTSAAVDEHRSRCEWSAGDQHADYDVCGAYTLTHSTLQVSQLMAILKTTLVRCAMATPRPSGTPAQLQLSYCYLQALNKNAGAEWHAELNYGHDAADGSYMAGDPILDGSCDTGSHMQQ